MKQPPPSRVRQTPASWSLDDDDYYGPSPDLTGPAASSAPVQALTLGRPQLSREQFFLPQSRPLQPPAITADLIPHYDALIEAGVTFPKSGPGIGLPWRAHHAALPPDFEQPSASDREDWQRVLQLRHVGSERARELEKLLAVPWGHLPGPTLASSRFCRLMRVRLVAGFKSWLDGQPPGQLYHASMVSHLFFAPEAELSKPQWSARLVKGRFRQQLIDNGLSQNGGWMLAGLDATYERSPSGRHTGYQMHFHCIIDARMKATIDSLAKDKKFYPKTVWVIRPFRVDLVDFVEGIATYLAKAYWTTRNSADAIRPEDKIGNGRRLNDLRQLEVLDWFDRQRFADLIFTHQCNLPRYVHADGWLVPQSGTCTVSETLD